MRKRSDKWMIWVGVGAPTGVAALLVASLVADAVSQWNQTRTSNTLRAARGVERYATFVEVYHAFTGEWPGTLQHLVDPPSDIVPITEEVGVDPWGNEYEFRLDDLRGFSLCSRGRDGLLGTNDDICA